jgi:hypothetical protein
MIPYNKKINSVLLLIFYFMEQSGYQSDGSFVICYHIIPPIKGRMLIARATM